MIEQGIVSDVKEGKLIVNIKRHAACAGCKACGMRESGLMKIEFENTINARKGDKVNIELDDSAILKGAFLFYVVPLLGLIFGIFLGKILVKDEATSAIFGIVTMILAYIGVRKYSIGNKKRYRPNISKANNGVGL